jgi:hypothetical protein
MDGLQIGIPVISHEVSARGYETFARSGSVFIYNSVASFENAVNLLVKSKFDRKQIQMTYEEFFSFETGKKRVKCILEEIVPL